MASNENSEEIWAACEDLKKSEACQACYKACRDSESDVEPDPNCGECKALNNDTETKDKKRKWVAMTSEEEQKEQTDEDEFGELIEILNNNTNTNKPVTMKSKEEAKEEENKVDEKLTPALLQKEAAIGLKARKDAKNKEAEQHQQVVTNIIRLAVVALTSIIL